ncbi:MAG: rod-binding protein [Candidatus Lambdaproteobacteria bacterium]|nr:rod-binding protein [Candidatus Lambdaproteobacteria bacterium]
MRISVDPRLDLGAALGRARGAGLRQDLPKDNPAALRKTAEEFESLLIEQLVREMRKTIPRSDLFGGREHEQMFEELLDGEYAQTMVRRGGLGIADLLMAQWQRNGTAR